MPDISIITIGDELLIGQVIDTNSAWMAQELNKEGFNVIRRVAIADEKQSILTALSEEEKHAAIILITGGLGPTSDDITKPTLCQYFNGRMKLNEEALENVKYLFEKVFKKPVTPINLKQAEVPDCCRVLQNKRGTAPGMLFEKNNAVFISLPGVPYEMQGLMLAEVIPFLKEKFTAAQIIHKTLLTVGIGESALAEKIKDFESALPESIKLAYLPSYGMVRLRLTTKAEFHEKIRQDMDFAFEELKKLTAEYLVTSNDLQMQEVVAEILTLQNKTLATAESCTGGYIAHLLTSIPGSSKFFNGSVVSYTNQAKEKLLQVQSSTIQQFGAVSENTVKEMLPGALKQLDSNYAIAVSGIMGPDGGTDEKPVGTVWVAVGNSQKIITQKFHFRFNRLQNIHLTALNALNLLRKFLLENN
ncbi:MAG: competence/damage-inducible protein A [Bacteroidetes bacterium]|nr:competence/damage-inducible protein A [Bacteroidota bacterium]MBS1925992.1 competence/damage-inducible protein A [Bacteroidota bacterium]HMU25606.1 competence/damage-inducible protein A [Ferruginibacter sp.]